MATRAEALAMLEQAEAEGKVNRARILRERLGLPPKEVTPNETVAEDVAQGFSFGEMASNIPGSAMGVASDIYQAVTNPIDTAAGLGQSLIGGLQHVQERAGPAGYLAPFALANVASAMGEDYRPQASAVAEMVGERYGSPEAALSTLEQDPVGVLADVSSVAGAAAPRLAARVNPLSRIASDLAQQTGRNILESATKFSKTLPTEQNARMVETMLEQGIKPTGGGVERLQKLVRKQGEVVDNLIAQADATGGTVPIDTVLARLDELKRDRGTSIVSGPQNVAAIDNFVDQISENALRLNKTELSASDLQQLKRDLYDQIAWNVRRQVDEVPVLEDAKKMLARSSKEAIEDVVPEAKAANERLGRLLELEPHLERSARRIEDRNLFGLGDFITAGAGAGLGSLAGSPWLGGAVGVGLDLITNPKVSPYVASGLYRGGQLAGSPQAQFALSYPYIAAQLQEEE